MPRTEDSREPGRSSGRGMYVATGRSARMTRQALDPAPMLKPAPRLVYESAARRRTPRIESAIMPVVAPVTGPRASVESWTPGFGSKSGYSGRNLQDTLEWIAISIWPFSALNSISEWLEEGHWSARALSGWISGITVAFLLFNNFPHTQWLQSVAHSASLQGYGSFVMIFAAVLVGLTILPRVLSLTIAVMIRVTICGFVVATLGAIGYGGYMALQRFGVF